MKTLLRLIFIITFPIFMLFGCESKTAPSGVVVDLRSRLNMVSGFSNFREMTYQVDNGLNLQVTRQIRFELYPQILTPQEPSADAQCQHEPDQSCGHPKMAPMRSGLYLLRYALLRNGFEDSKATRNILDAGEMIVEVVSGAMIVDLPLRLKDLRLSGSRNELLLELAMIQEDKVRPLADHKFAPLEGLSYSDILDQSADLKPEVFETTLDGSTNARLLFAPFSVADLESSVSAQIESHRPWLGNSGELKAAVAASRGISNLGDVVARFRTLEKLAAAQEKRIKDSFTSTQDLIDVSSGGSTLISEGDRQKLVAATQTETIDDALYVSLCNTWLKKVIPDILQEHFHIGPRHDLFDPGFAYECLGGRRHILNDIKFLRRLGLEYTPFLIFQTLYLVDSAKFKSLAPPGRNFSIQIGHDFYVRSRTEFNFEGGLRPLSWIPIIGTYLSLAGTMAIDASLKEDHGNSMRFATNMQLEVEQNAMAVEFGAYKRCLMVRFNPERKLHPQIRRLIELPETELQRDQMLRALGERGLLVCDSLENQKPVTKLENYYYIYPAKSVGYQQDPTDIRNRPLSLSLRGERDFQVFMEASKSRMEEPDSTQSTYNGLANWWSDVIGAVRSAPPAFPGVFVDHTFY